MRYRSLTTAAFAAFFAMALPATAFAVPHPLWLGMEEMAGMGSGAGSPLALSKKIASTGVRFQRVSVSWRELQPTRPADATGWGDSNFDQSAISHLDDMLRAAADLRPGTGAGLPVLLQVESAPDWAQTSDRPGNGGVGSIGAELSTHPGAWRPDATEFGNLAQALATRYDGNDRHNTYDRLLPKVEYFQGWNEPNISTHLAPQELDSGAFVGADLYRALLNSFYTGLRAGGRTDVKVVAAGLSPFGRTRGIVQGTYPQAFARAVLCVQRRGSTWSAKGSCGPVSFDIWAQHPYDIVGSPSRGPDSSGQKGLMADIPAIRSAVAAAVRLGTALPKVAKRMWVTEFDWWTNPPSSAYGKSPALAARYTTDSLWHSWAAGVDALFWHGVRDNLNWSGGLWFASKYVAVRDLTPEIIAADRAKPALKSFKWPFREVPRRTPYAWGIVPCRLAGQKVVIEQVVRRRWRPVTHGTSAPSGVFQIQLSKRGRGVGRWRAKAPASCGAYSQEWNSRW
ncbi:MAG: hypothetical protein WCJ63_05755 [Actinomycetes bacterium]